MSIQRKTPQPLARTSGEYIQNQVPLYTTSQRNAQAAISRRYHISPAHARVIAGLLLTGGVHG